MRDLAVRLMFLVGTADSLRRFLPTSRDARLSYSSARSSPLCFLLRAQKKFRGGSYNVGGHSVTCVSFTLDPFWLNFRAINLHQDIFQELPTTVYFKIGEVFFFMTPPLQERTPRVVCAPLVDVTPEFFTIKWQRGEDRPCAGLTSSLLTFSFFSVQYHAFPVIGDHTIFQQFRVTRNGPSTMHSSRTFIEARVIHRSEYNFNGGASSGNRLTNSAVILYDARQYLQ